jgi:hypothetical protein
VQAFVAVVVAVGMWATRERRPTPGQRAGGHVHGVVSQWTSDASAPDRQRGLAAQCLMRTPAVIESNPCGDPGMRLAAIGVALEIDLLVLQGAPQPKTLSIQRPRPGGMSRSMLKWEGRRCSP